MDEQVIKDRLKSLAIKNAAMEQQIADLQKRILDIGSLAGKRIVYSQPIEITLNQGESEVQTKSVSLSRSGPFVAERLYCSLRIKEVPDGGTTDWVGRYLPLSSLAVYPYIWPSGATGTIAYDPPLDFEFGWESNQSDRQRQDKYIPGDILDRGDNDGIFPVSDIFTAGSQITFKLKPHRAVGGAAPWSTGVTSFLFTATFVGYKIIQPTQV